MSHSGSLVGSGSIIGKTSDATSATTPTSTICQTTRRVASDTATRMPGPAADTDTKPKTLVSSATGNGHRRR